jgi:hypothetical protein
MTSNIDDGRAPRDPEDAAPAELGVTLWAAHFRDLVAWKIDYASLQMTSCVHIQGEPFAMMLVSGIVRAFRDTARAEGAKV